MKYLWVPAFLFLTALVPAALADDKVPGAEAIEQKESPKPKKAKPDERDRAEWRGWDHGWLRVEGTVKAAWKSGHEQRAGDCGLRAVVDYEVPVRKHLTVSPRLIPLMYWDENNAGDNEIFAAGGGISIRGYPRAYEYRGIYGELGAMIIGQTDTFEGSTSYFNFMEEIGVGYVFQSDWNVAFKIGHISNAGLSSENAGVNWASLTLGYSFRRR